MNNIKIALNPRFSFVLIFCMAYRGFRFGEIRDARGNHHYVEFDAGDNAVQYEWKVSRKPFVVIEASSWGVAENGYFRVGFKWADFAPVVGIQPQDFEIEKIGF